MKRRYDAFRNPGLSVGWLFADLLLALAMIFLLANTLAMPPAPEPIPTLTVSPMSLDWHNCSGGTAHPRCTVTVGETANSKGQLQWTAKNDMSDSIVFSPPHGVLSPGETKSVTISAIPCQNGSITFSGSRNASPVTILWHCTPPVDRLNFKYQEFTLTLSDNDIQGLLSTLPSQSAINDVEHQVRSQRNLQQGSVGLAIVYDGAPDVGQIGNARTIAQNVINILGMLGQRGFAFQRASYYGPLYALYSPQNVVTIDVYLFMQ